MVAICETNVSDVSDFALLASDITETFQNVEDLNEFRLGFSSPCCLLGLLWLLEAAEGSCPFWWIF